MKIWPLERLLKYSLWKWISVSTSFRNQKTTPHSHRVAPSYPQQYNWGLTTSWTFSEWTVSAFHWVKNSSGVRVIGCKNLFNTTGSRSLASTCISKTRTALLPGDNNRWIFRHSGKKYDSIEESPVKFQKYKRNLEPQHLYLHGDLQPQVELAPTKNNQGIEVRHGRKL